MINKLLKILKIKFIGEVILKDGTPCVLDGDLAIGVGIKVQTPDGMIDLPDGNYELETGQIISVENGKIVDITDQIDTEEIPDDDSLIPTDMKQDVPVEEIPIVETEVKDEIVKTIELVENLEPIIETNPYDILLEKITSIETKLENLPTYTDELTKLKGDVDFILGKMTLSTELKKSKPIDESTSIVDSRIELIKSIRNTKK